jgi:hypothetical protein
LANPNLSIQAIDPTLPWAKPTFLQKLIKELDPLNEFSFFKETDIGRDKSHINNIYEPYCF